VLGISACAPPRISPAAALSCVESPAAAAVNADAAITPRANGKNREHMGSS